MQIDCESIKERIYWRLEMSSAMAIKMGDDARTQFPSILAANTYGDLDRPTNPKAHNQFR